MKTNCLLGWVTEREKRRGFGGAKTSQAREDERETDVASKPRPRERGKKIETITEGRNRTSASKGKPEKG